MTTDIEKIFKNIDFEKGTYNIKDISMKIKDLSIAEMEELQDREAALNDLDPKLSPKEILKEARKWQKFILDLAFGKQWKEQKLTEKLNAAEYKTLIEEVFVFLGRYSGPQGALEYITTLKEKKD